LSAFFIVFPHLSSQYRNFRRGGSCTAFLEKIKTEETEMKLKKSGDNGGYWLSRSAANPVSSSLGWGFVRDAGPLRYQCVRCRKKINLRSGCICRKNPAAPDDSETLNVTYDKSLEGGDGYSDVYTDGDGNEYLFYYVNNVRQVGTGLVQLDDGSYIYVRSGANLAVGSYYVSKTNDLLPKGTYTFGEDGKMVVNP